MEKNNELRNNNVLKWLQKTWISELDSINFGLDKYRDDFCDSYRKTYRHRYWLKNCSKKNDFSPYRDADLNEEKWYNLFGIFKDLEEYKKEKYSFDGIRSILQKSIKKYKFPNIKEQWIITDIPEKIKTLFDSYVLEPKKEWEFSNLTDDNLTKVFYMILLVSIYEKLQNTQHKYTQQKIDFWFDK